MKRISRFNKVVIAAALVAASGGASLGITSLVSANTSGATDVIAVVADMPGDLEANTVAPTVSDAVVAAATDTDAATGSDETVTSEAHERRGPASAAMAELFGMTQDELHEALHSGKSLAVIAEEKNVELSKVTDLLVSEFSAHLDEHVAEGKLTAEEAAAKLATFKENVDTMVTQTPPARGEGRGGHGPGIKGGLHSEELATLFGMTQDELHDAMHSGKSLATIAEEKNVELSKVTDLLVSEMSDRLDQAVADEKLTREEADAKLATFKENVDTMITQTPPARGEGGPAFGRGHGGRHGGPHGGMMNDGTTQGSTDGTGTAYSA